MKTKRGWCLMPEYALWSQPMLPLWQRILLLPLYLFLIAYWCLAGYNIDVKVWKEEEVIA